MECSWIWRLILGIKDQEGWDGDVEDGIEA
jgi:hypothetical protein